MGTSPAHSVAERCPSSTEQSAYCDAGEHQIDHLDLLRTDHPSAPSDG